MAPWVPSAGYCSPVKIASLKGPLATQSLGVDGKTVHSQTIEGLRGYAVLAVLIYHFFPSILPGGFIGVDVFFTVSGYLVVGSLANKIVAGQKISIFSFWSSRIARVAPIAFIVLSVSLAAGILRNPTSELLEFSEQIKFAVTFRANTYFSKNAVNYLGGDGAGSLVLHFWSLSIEEQVYIFVPLLGIIVAWILSRVSELKRLFSLQVLLGIIAVVSFVACLRNSAVAPSLAFFGLTSRVWQFSAGALVRLSFTKSLSLRLTLALGLSGVGMLLVSVFSFDEGTVYPGWAALLPTSATALLLSTVKGHGGRFMAQRIAKWFGRISYSLYMWHWPILKLFGSAGRINRLVLMVLSIVTARMSWQFLESPSREYLKSRQVRGVKSSGRCMIRHDCR